MNRFIWDDLLSDADRAVIDAAGYATRGASTFSSRRGGASPALLIIDMQRLFVGEDKPALDAIADAPSMIGAAGWRAIDHIVSLMAVCRGLRVPVIYACMRPENRAPDDPLLAIVDGLAPRASDPLLYKRGSSAFFGTDLAAHLEQRGCDSVIVTGNSTSGCVRATVVDATQRELGVYVPVECVFDRIAASHKIGLLDMWMKYAVVLPVDDMIARLGSPEKVAHGD